MVVNEQRLRRVVHFALPLLLLLQGCGTSTLFLKKGQYLFVQARIKGTSKLDPEAVAALQQQKPNRQILGSAPYLYFYQLGEKFYNKKKEQAKFDSLDARLKAMDAVSVGVVSSTKTRRLRAKAEAKLEKQRLRAEQGNWLMRTVGEPPSIFDTTAMQTTLREMHNYLFNAGFFSGTATARVDTLARRQIRVTYRITEGPPQIIRAITYMAYDSLLQHLVDSLVKRGPRQINTKDRYDQDRIAAERERLDKGIRNSGFYAFSREYIFADADTGVVDSTLGHRAIDLRFVVKNPTTLQHERYVLEEAEFHVSAASSFEKSDTTVRIFNGITYFTPYRRISYRTLDSKVLVRPNQYYNSDKLTRSQAQLQQIDIFRFVNFSFDTIQQRHTRFKLRIDATRLPKYQISNEVGLLISQGAPGPFINEGFKVRNALNSFDIFELSARYSIEGQVSAFSEQGVYRATTFGITAAETFPAIILPGYTSYLFRDKNPKTRISIGYEDLKRPEYNQTTIKATAGYSINLNQQELVGINLIDASIVRSGEISDSFKVYLDKQERAGNPLIRTFDQQIVTSLSGFYVYNSANPATKSRGRYLRLFGELGGFIPNTFAYSYNTENRLGRYFYVDQLGVRQYYRVSRFAKAQLDYRYYYPTSKTTMWVARINTGIAIPLGDSRILPYNKYFFAGGSNSIRAWAPRRLGPGTYSGGSTAESNAEQPGEILFEANLEIRSKIIGFFEGALFADLGNVFTLKEEVGRPGSGFKAGKFFETLALGVGPGLRMDFSFLVVRLDMGIKAYDPSSPQGVKWVIRDALRKPTQGYQRVLLNLGIGYPF